MKRRALALVCAILVPALSFQSTAYAYLTGKDLDTGAPFVKSAAPFQRIYKLVAIDPGHGGSDPGAIGNGLVEKEINLDVALRVRNLLLAKGYTVVMTRTTDTDVNRTFADVNGNGVSGEAADELQARVNVGNNAGADIFVCIHHNASSYSSATGTEVFYNAYSSEGRSLAVKLADSISTQLGFYNRGAKVGNYYITNRTLMPSVITEAGFLTNPSDAFRLAASEGRQLEAEAIVKGIDAYYGISSPPQTQEPGPGAAPPTPEPGPPPGTVNDISGDGRSDSLAFYNYGNATSGIWGFTSVSQGSNLPPAVSASIWWKSAQGSFDASRAKTVTGDFNGDGKTDVLSLYNYGGTTSALWLWKSTGTALNAPQKVFHSTGWDWSRTKLVSGDFDGDAKDELLAFYGYGGTTTGAFLFEQTAGGEFAYPKKIWNSTTWDWTKTRFLSTNDYTKPKVVAVYDYGGTTTGVWRFELNEGPTLGQPQRAFFSNGWNYQQSTFLIADIEGDGQDDLVAYYNYGGTTTGAFLFRATGGSTFAYPERVFFSTAWNYASTGFVPGDFDGDGDSDVGAAYAYSSGMKIIMFASDGKTLTYPTPIYSTSNWSQSAVNWLMPY